MERIICVDDDPLCLLLGEMVIKETKLAKETIMVESGSDALSLLNRLYTMDPDAAKKVSTGSATENTSEEKQSDSSTVIFLDINMPVMSGWDFLELLEKKYPHMLSQLKVVILSSSIDPEDIQKSKQYKAVSGFISKPLTIDAVKSVNDMVDENKEEA